MRPRHGWYGALLGAALGLWACSGDEGGTDPDPETDPGSVRATVTGDGDPLPGVTVELYPDGGSTPITSGTSNASGQVLFGDLDPADYDVAVEVPSGFVLAGGETARRSVVVESDEIAALTFALEELVAPPTEGQIRVRVQDGVEPIEDVTVHLYASGGSTPLESGTTGPEGFALFADLTPATYDIEIELPDDHTLAPGDSIRKSRTVTAGVTTEATFAVDAPLPTLVVVTAAATSFGPDDVTIATGGTVRWVWQSNPHTVTPAGHTEWTEATLDGPGDVFEHVFDTPGTYQYLCEVHAGMTGVVRVQNP